MASKSKSTEEEEDIFIGKLFFNKYKLIRKLGQGSFGSIYEGQSIYSNKLYAVKIEDMKQDQYILEEESLLLSYLNFNRVPKLKSFGYSGSYIILIMELLGSSLDKIFKELPSKKMSIRCVCNIAYQLIFIFETLHNYDIVHRDIKPANIAIGREDKHKFIYLLDFGLSKKFRSSTSKKHMPFIKNNKLIGNARYSSINALEGCSQSRRDDLESIGYVLIYLLQGRLPWQGYISRSKEDKYYKIKQIKRGTTPEELCEGLPPQFEEYIKYTRSLEYEQDPDYDYLKNLFLTILKNFNWEFDYFYDWDQEPLTNSEIGGKDKDKEKENINNSISNKKSSLSKEYSNSKIYSKIKELILERRKYGIFNSDRFVFDIEEESNIALQKLKSGNETEPDLYNNYSNSMTPYENPKRRVRNNNNYGCFPCQSKGYKDKDNSCCIIY